jgi:hypothetical protein
VLAVKPVLVVGPVFVVELVLVELVLAAEWMQLEIGRLEQQDEAGEHWVDSIVERSSVDVVDMALDTEARFQDDTAELQVNSRLEYIPAAT